MQFCMSALDKLDWSLIQAFLAVAETGSLSSAARELHLTQPTVGRHIQSLEQDLGVSLFKRQARGMALTTQAMNTMRRTMFRLTMPIRSRAIRHSNRESAYGREALSIFL